MTTQTQQYHQDITSLILPYLGNPSLIFGGSYYSRRVIDASAIIRVLDANPGLELGDVKVKKREDGKNVQAPLIENFMDEVGSLSSLVIDGKSEAVQAVERIGLALINRHGCNPWECSTERVMELLNRITMLKDPPLGFVKAVIQHPGAPTISQIEVAIASFKSGDWAGRKRGPVHYACTENRPDLASFWLGLGFGVSARDADGRLPIVLATSPEMAKLLLGAGSAITQVNADDQGVMDAWGEAVSASAKEAMGKEVSWAIEQGLVRVDRELLLEMARNDTGRRKIEEMMRASSISWWDTHEDGSIARLALVDILARYLFEPKFVQARMTSLVSSACDWARREAVDIPDLDRMLLWTAKTLCGMEKINVKRPDDHQTASLAFSMVFPRVNRTVAEILSLARDWDSNDLMGPSNAVDLLACIEPASRQRMKERQNYANRLDPDFSDDSEGNGAFLHRRIPEMIGHLSQRDLAAIVPSLVVLSNDLMGRSTKSFTGGEKYAGGLQQALMSMHIPSLAQDIDRQAMEEALELFHQYEKLYAGAAGELKALESAWNMSRQVAPAGERTRGPRL